MPDTLTQTGVILASLVAALALASAIRKTVARREWSIGALVGAGIVLLTLSFIQLVVTYLGAWTKNTDVYRNVYYEVPEWALMSLRITTTIMGIVAVAMFIRGLSRRDSQVNLPAVLLVLVLCVSLASALLQGQIPVRVLSLAYLCILMACIFAPRGLSVHLGIGTICMVATIASGIALVAHHDFSVIECVAGHKCGLLGFNFRGVLDNENALALYLALAIPFVYIGFGGWEGVVMAGYMTGLALLTGSRSGTLAAVITFLVLVVIRPNIRRPQRTPWRSTALTAGLVLVAAVGIALPLLIQNESGLTGRVALWKLARSALADPATLAYGTGLFGWDDVRESGLIDSSAVYSVHNQWLHVLFSTGLIGLLLFLGAIALLLWQARDGYYTVAACVLVPCFLLAVTERPWPIDTADWLTWAVPGALLCYPLSRRNSLTEQTATPTPEPTAIDAGDPAPTSSGLQEVR